MLNAIDNAKTKDGVPLFSPAHFDLIIVDESHRSIFKMCIRDRTMQQRVFPAIKKMKYGRLPDFDANGELVEIEDATASMKQKITAWERAAHC